MKLVVAFLSVVAVWGCASSGIRPLYTPVLLLPIDSTLGGVTVCDMAGEPVVVMNAIYRNRPTFRFIHAHEMKHVEQMRSYREGCNAFLVRYSNDLDFRMKSEAEAMCAELYLASSEGIDTSQDVERIAHQLIAIALKVEVVKTRFEVMSVIPCKPSG